MATRIAKKAYDDQSIKSLKGADRVRKRPAVIFGSDDLIGCQHSFIEILANSVDEAREGYGDKIIVKKYKDLSIEVEDFGRGVPLGYNEKEKRYNWELVFCELYAGGKYDNNDGNSAYEFSLGLNGLGATATQYSSEYMSVRSYNGKTLSEINFKSGNVKGDLSVTDIEPGMKKRGTIIRWRPDLKVFKEIDIPVEFLSATLRRQAFVNAGIKFILEIENDKGKFDKSEYYYEQGVADYIAEITEGISTTQPVLWSFETQGRDREDLHDVNLIWSKPERKSSACVLEKNCNESLKRSERCTVDHDRTMLLVVASDILELEALRKVVVDLDCTELPLSSDSVLYHEVEFRAVECSLTIFNYCIKSFFLSRLDDCSLCLCPILVCSDIL